jgi:hypothetical protein
MSVSRLHDDDPDEPGVLRLPSGSYIRPVRAEQADTVYDDLLSEQHRQAGDEDQDADLASPRGPLEDRWAEVIRRAAEDWQRSHPEAAAETRARDQAERAWLAAMTPRSRRRRRWAVYTVYPETRPWCWIPGYYWYRATSWPPRRWWFHAAWWLAIILLTLGAYRLVT